MKYIILFISIFCFLAFSSSAQKINFSDKLADETLSMDFEIIGKQGNNYLIYKNIRKKHMLSVYGQNMELINNYKINQIPEKTFNVFFITYPEKVFMIYQYQKGKTVYCAALSFDNNGNPIGEAIILDETKIGAFSDRRVYTTTYSENKNQILIYKMLRRSNKLYLQTYRYNAELNMIKNTQDIFDYKERFDIFSDLSINNDGEFVLAKATRKGSRESVYKLELFSRMPESEAGTLTDIPLNGSYIDEVLIKPDNINKRFLLNSLYSIDRNDNISGLFTLAFPFNITDSIKSAFNAFPDSIRTSFNTSGSIKYAFESLYLRNIIVKNDGGFIISNEEQTTKTIGDNYYRNRNDYLYGNPYGTSDYYNYSPSYYNYGRYMPYSNNYRTTQYNYDNILVNSIDKDLKPQWNRIIVKRQQDTETDNFISFSIMNTGGLLHYIFMEKERANQNILNMALSADGQIIRYPSFKSRDAGYQFLTNSSKQVTASKIILPCINNGFIVFALVDFS